MGEIVVNGVRNIVTLGDPFYGSGNFWDSNNINPNDGVELSASPEDNYPKAREVKCVSTKFEITNTEASRVNNAALDVSNQIKDKKGKEANWEWGAIIYELNGVVEHTPPFTSELPDRISWQFGLAPNGAIVIGTLHSQPYEGVEDQRIPSPGDWDVFDRIMKPDFVDSFGNKFQIDRNMLQYIVTNQDNLTRVYDRKDKPLAKDVTKLQCYLEAK
jgi:hypothetical protein